MMTTGTRTDGIDASASAHDVCARLAEAAAGIRSAAPRFSVLIPCFNAEATLGETLSSLAAQRFTDFEAVVLDDGSSDGSAKIAADTASRDARFRLVRLENGGPSRARNIGAYLHAWADLIAFLDSDDLFVPEKLARMAERFDAADAPDAVYGRIAFFRGAPESARTISTILPQPLEARDLLRENPVCTMSNILTLRLYGEGPRHREVVSRAGGHERIEFADAPADRRAVFAAVDGLAVPARFDASGLVALEALAAGLPVLTGPTDASPALARAGARVVPENTSRGWREAMARCDLRTVDIEGGPRHAERAEARFADAWCALVDRFGRDGIQDAKSAA